MIVLRPEAFLERPSCVLLDLDNTLYDYAECNKAGMTAARQLAQQLLNLAPDDFDQCFRDARTELKNRLGATASSHSRLLYFQRTVERAGFTSQPAVALQLEHAFWRTFMDRITLFAGALDFLHDLRIAGVPVAIVTDLTAQIQLRKIVLLGLDRVVDWIVTSEETGADKPDPRGFELAVAKFGGVEGKVWAIGDNIACDLESARKAMDATTLLKVTGKPAAPPTAECVDAIFSNFSDVRRLFAKLGTE
ncbi:MAG: HAD family hydrolase [Sphingomicrobium sp.]